MRDETNSNEKAFIVFTVKVKVVYILYLCNILYIHYAWCVGGTLLCHVYWQCGLCRWWLLTGCDLIQRLTKKEEIFYLFGIR